MTDIPWCDVKAEEGWTAARGLASRLGDSHPLPVIELEFMGAADEALHADLDLRCWWWCADSTPTWEHREFVDFRGLGVFALTAAASALGNRQRRHAALLAAAPRWRPFGTGRVRVLLTSQRLVICTGDDAVSLWFDEGLRLVPDVGRRRVELLAETAPPFAVEGPWAPYLAVALTYRLSSEILCSGQREAPETAIVVPRGGQQDCPVDGRVATHGLVDQQVSATGLHEIHQVAGEFPRRARSVDLLAGRCWSGGWSAYGSIDFPPHSSGATSRTVSVNCQRWPARSSRVHSRSP